MGGGNGVAGGDEIQLHLTGLLGFLAGDVAAFGHLVEDAFLALAGKFGVGAEGRVAGRRDSQSSQQGRLGQIEVGGGFAEISLGGGFDTPGGSAVGGLVEVHFQDLIFGIEKFSTDGENSFSDLALDGSFRGKQGVFNQLLGDGGAALKGAVKEDVSGGAENTAEIKAVMAVKVFIFGGDSGPFDVVGQIGKLNGEAVFIGINLVEEFAVAVVD